MPGGQNMKLSKLFAIQKVLDKKIIKEHNLEGQDLLPRKILALKVELGELANETRCFKFWSNKGPSKKETILEEYVDCIHFILSISNDVNFHIEKYDFTPYVQVPDLTEQFNACFSTVNMAEDRDFEEEHVKYMIENFLGLAQLLGFSPDEIINAYLEKNKVNFERLANGY